MASKKKRERLPSADEEIINVELKDLEEGHNDISLPNKDNLDIAATEDESFKRWYVQQITECFGEELNALRKDPDTFTGTAEDLSSLIIALRTGESNAVFESAAKRLAVTSVKTQSKQKRSKE